VTFVETRLFTKLVQEYLSDDCGRGKRGGLRVIYFLRVRDEEIWMLTLYAKNVSDNIPAKVLKKIKEEIDVQG
jgi:hypothetical protein